jgi:hypothetical protein
MKKQLLIAAVAATFASVSMADISLAGKGNMKVKSNGTSSIDLDLTVSGKFDGGSFSAKMKNMQSSTAFSDVYVATTIEGVSVKAGTVKTQLGNGTLYKKTAKDLVVSTTAGGFGITATMMPGQTDAALHISGSVAGFDVKVQNATASSRMISVSGDIAGVSVAMETTKQTGGTNSAYSISGSTSGLDITYAAATINSTVAGSNQADDNIFGNIDALKGGEKATALQVKTATAFGPATVKFAKVNGVKTNSVSVTNANVTYKYSKTTAANAKLSAKVTFKF